MGILEANPTGRDFPCWTDSMDVTWEFNYVVTQFADEGPEYLEARQVRPTEAKQWYRVNEGDIPEEVDRALEKHFCG